MKIHFSVDDTLNCFLWLTRNREHIKSIFDSKIFSTARSIHDIYGINVTLYCMYTNGIYSLEDVPNCWKKEFIDNADWLKFGFHCFNPQSNYNRCGRHEIIYQYRKLEKQLFRITGTDKNIADTLRLHFFSGNSEVISGLSECGIRCFLCADDDRVSYGLPLEINQKIKEKDYFYDKEIGCYYIPTHIRIEKIKNIMQLISNYKDKEFITMFTHEPRLMEEKNLIIIRNVIDGLRSL